MINNTKQVAANKLALQWYILPGLLVGAIALIIFSVSGVSAVPITGTISMASIALYGCAVTGLLAFGLAYYYAESLATTGGKQPLRRRLLDGTTLTFSHWIVALAITAIVAFLLNNSFKGLLLDVYAASFVIALVVCINAFVLIRLGANITVNHIVTLLSIVMVGGVTLVMTTNNRPTWWQENFSYLGTPGSSNHFAFNLTIVVAGLIMLALAHVVFESFHSQHGHIKYLEILFIATALALVGVGLFPYKAGTAFATLHNLSATSLVVLLLGMIGGLKWYVPSLPKEFLYTSYCVAGLLLAATVLWSIEYFNQTAFELSAFGLSFIWLVLLLRNLELVALSHD